MAPGHGEGCGKLRAAHPHDTPGRVVRQQRSCEAGQSGVGRAWLPQGRHAAATRNRSTPKACADSSSLVSEGRRVVGRGTCAMRQQPPEFVAAAPEDADAALEHREGLTRGRPASSGDCLKRIRAASERPATAHRPQGTPARIGAQRVAFRRHMRHFSQWEGACAAESLTQWCSPLSR